jgi:hypothetical protein
MSTACRCGHAAGAVVPQIRRGKSAPQVGEELERATKATGSLWCAQVYKETKQLPEFCSAQSAVGNQADPKLICASLTNLTLMFFKKLWISGI